MSDFTSLGSEKRTLAKFIFLAIVLFATIYVFSIFLGKWSQLDSETSLRLYNESILSIVSIVGLVISGLSVVYIREYRKYVSIIFISVLAFSVFFLRNLITSFYILPLPSGIGLSVIYTVMGVISSIVLGFNTISPKIKPPIDTVSVEEKEEKVVRTSLKIDLVISLVVFILTLVYISAFKQAFVQAPIFGVYDVLFAEALISGIVGGVLETAFFFSCLLPIIHASVYMVTESQVLSSLIGILGVTLLFYSFHTTVYAYNQPALVSVALFGLGQSVLTFLFRNNIINMSWHFGNNFFVVLFRILKIAIFLVF